MRRITSDAAGELLEREYPLRALHAGLDTAAEGRGSVAVISGEPGIGKTALMDRVVAEIGRRAEVLLGVCDDLATPRPLGPFRDLVDDLPARLAGLLVEEEGADRFGTQLLQELRDRTGPVVLAIEDVHWADQATVDVVTMLGRRVPQLSVLLVLTLRPEELAPGDRLRTSLETLRRGTLLHLALEPLSPRAIARLAGRDTRDLHAATAGNPFFVTELLAQGSHQLPPSLAHAVLGRVARLDAGPRELLELVSVVPTRVRTDLLDVVAPDWARDVVPAERRRVLRVEHDRVAFVHELARTAVLTHLASGRRRELHTRVLEGLQRLGADPAEVVHHADHAGRADVAAAYALQAGRQAAASGAHREAHSHLERAARTTADTLDPAARVQLLEELATTAWLAGRVPEAVAAAGDALQLAEDRGDRVRQGRLLTLRARLQWFAGDGRRAAEDAHEAVRRLEPSGPSPALTRATAQIAELSMLVSDIDAAVRWGRRAIEQADARDPSHLRALTAMGGARIQHDRGDRRELDAAVEGAHAAGDVEQLVFALVTRAVIDLLWVAPADARRDALHARACAEEHQLEGLVAFIDALLAWLQLREGRKEGVARLARSTGTGPRDGVSSLADQLAQLVLAEHAVRSGADDAAERLDAAVDGALETRKLVHIVPALEMEIEHALLHDLSLPTARLSQIAGAVDTAALGSGVCAARIAAWSRVCGVEPVLTSQPPPPHAAMIEGRWREAADGMGAVGWRYDRALLLSLLDEPDALSEAVAIARELDAGPLLARASRRLRAVGRAVPHGPRRSTRRNPAQLTDRQLEVLRHLLEGRTNQEIADRLHVSPRTVEHHVTAILTKLGVSSRTQAVSRCIELGVP